MLCLTRKLTSGFQKIFDRKPVYKKDAEGNDTEEQATDENGDPVFDEFPHIIEAKDPTRYEPKEYFDEDFVLSRHGAIMCREADRPSDLNEHNKGRKGETVGKGSLTKEEWDKHDANPNKDKGAK